MAPIKFEEQLKDKLEKRTMSPSEDSWSKLSQRLDDDEQKSKNTIFWWLSIAAGIIIMIAVTVQFFNQPDIENSLPQIVDEEEIKQELDDESKAIFEEESVELANEDVVKGEQEHSENIKQPEIIDYKKVVNQKEQKQLVSDDKGQQNKSKVGNLEKQNSINLTLDKEAIDNAVAETLKGIKDTNSTVTDREVDSLLKLASKEIFKEQLLKETSKTVDAESLLMSVEDEMGQSFRTKVFEALKDSYETVRTAVAERNN
ncbi:hypothetical protein [Winogradskyella sp. SYSU M77433]|uniref:hypothetical protein n=1 Tax=Winogradskyella sp. SYSU M77433 TaxID=3042722 RepID=UPI002481390D|nr:hypothetical protein [Winogradskyella sp. SYSU M77433]MDH7911829.1 hypothetical protein [Winogradskyella sp. SYSU M77433]